MHSNKIQLLEGNADGHQGCYKILIARWTDSHSINGADEKLKDCVLQSIEENAAFLFQVAVSASSFLSLFLFLPSPPESRVRVSLQSPKLQSQHPSPPVTSMS